jgi:hypothetical protein
MNIEPSHRARAEDALANAQRNPVMSAEQSFLSAQVHALLALESRLEEVVIELRNAQLPTTVASRVIDEQHGAATHRPGRRPMIQDDIGDALDRAADDGWPDGAMRDHGTGLEVAR